MKEKNELNVFWAIKAGNETFTKLREATGLSSRGLCLVLDRLLESGRITKENEIGRGIYKISDKHEFFDELHEDFAKIHSNTFDYSAAALARLNETNDYYLYIVSEIKIMIFASIGCMRAGIQHERSGLEINAFLGMIVRITIGNTLRRLKEEKDERKRKIKKAQILKALKKIEREIKSDLNN